jgi:hypothetical protein
MGDELVGVTMNRREQIYFVISLLVFLFAERDTW